MEARAKTDMEVIAEEEVENAWRSVKTGKATGPDDIPVEASAGERSKDARCEN